MDDPPPAGLLGCYLVFENWGGKNVTNLHENTKAGAWSNLKHASELGKEERSTVKGCLRHDHLGYSSSVRMRNSVVDNEYNLGKGERRKKLGFARLESERWGHSRRQRGSEGFLCVNVWWVGLKAYKGIQYPQPQTTNKTQKKKYLISCELNRIAERKYVCDNHQRLDDPLEVHKFQVRYAGPLEIKAHV